MHCSSIKFWFDERNEGVQSDVVGSVVSLLKAKTFECGFLKDLYLFLNYKTINNKFFQYIYTMCVYLIQAEDNLNDFSS